MNLSHSSQAGPGHLLYVKIQKKKNFEAWIYLEGIFFILINHTTNISFIYSTCELNGIRCVINHLDTPLTLCLVAWLGGFEKTWSNNCSCLGPCNTSAGLPVGIGKLAHGGLRS